MGIHDREYYRDEGGGWFPGGPGRQATVGLIVFTCGVFLLQLMTRRPGFLGGQDLLTQWGAFDYHAILDGQVWRLVTPTFLHSSVNLWHVATNMFVLYWVGTALEGVYGTREFLAFYLTAGTLGWVGKFVLAAAGVSPDVLSIGASGAVTASLVLFACHFPRHQILLFFVIPMPVWLFAAGLVALDMFGFFGVGRAGIDFAAHLFGAMFGAVYYVRGLRILPAVDRVSEPFRRRPRLKVYSGPPPEERPADVPARPARPTPAAATTGRPVDEHLEAKLDAVLEKVSRFGKESLTPEENDILLRASEIYKRRRGS